MAPWLKYPPNPPAVGDPDTLAQRQILYVSLICLTAVVGVAAAALSTRLRREGWSEARRVTAVVVAVAVPLGIAMAGLPGAPDPITVPADLLWRFRLASLGRQPAAVDDPHPRLRPPCGRATACSRARGRRDQYSIPLSAPMPES